MDFEDNKITALKNLISDLADRPTESATELKEYFDGNSRQIQDAFNNLIDELNKNNTYISDSINAKADAIETKKELETKANKTTVKNSLDTKVDKVDGMGLSSNDYTTEEKQKLESLYNYDDSAVKSDVSELNEELKTKADAEDVNTALFKKVDKTEGKGLSTNDYTNAEKERLENSVNYKGDIEEISLPAEGNSKGDLYKLTGSYAEKEYASVKVVWQEPTVSYSIEGLYRLMTAEENEALNVAYETQGITDFNLSVDFYTTDWQYVTTVQGIEYGEGPLSFNVNGAWDTIPVGLEADVDYYAVRTDFKSPEYTLPTHSIYCKKTADYAIYNGESFDKFYAEESFNKAVDSKIAQETKLKLIRKITLKEDVIDVKFTFDKPLSEIVFYFAGTFDETANNRILSITSDNRSWYMCNRGINISTSPIYYYAHAKETKERFWESHVLSTSTTSLLNGYSNNILFISERPEVLSRYVKDLSITIASVTHYIKAGSIIEIWGREVDE